MAGLSREDLIGLSAKDLAVKLTEVGVPKSLTEALHAMGIKGSTLLLMDAEDIKYELSELFVEERIHLRNFLREIRKQEELPEHVPVLLLSDSSSSREKKRSSSASSTSGSTVSLYSSDDSSPQSQTPNQTQGNDRFGEWEKYKPLDLPSNFEVLTSFGKKVDKALQTDFKQPGSLPHDLTNKVVNQVADYIESENPRPS